MIKRLRIKFICINMLIVTTMLLAIFGMVFCFTRMNLEIQSLRAMRRVAERPMKQSVLDDGQEEIRLPYFLVVVDHQGKLIAVSEEFFDLSGEDQLLDLVGKAYRAETEDGVLRSYDLRFFKTVTPQGTKIVFSDISGEKAVLKGLLQICAFIGIISFGIFFIISYLLARWAIKPVERAWNQQRQFVADASHELKTPLTVIITNAELLREPEYSEADKQRFAGSILTMSRQMRGLVESLLELARVDNGAVKTVFSKVDLSSVTEEALLPFEPVYFEKELVLESSIAEGLCVRGSREHLQQVVDILLDNAAKYSSPGGKVVLELRQQGGCGLLSVSNPGAELSREELRNIFKRFYRADKSRSMNHSYGLGLPIADSIVREHGGKIWAESSGGINTFFVQLPMI